MFNEPAIDPDFNSEVGGATVTNEISDADQVKLEDFMKEAIDSDKQNLSNVLVKDLYAEMERGCVFIAKVGDEIVGMVRAIPIADFRAISTTYVSKDFQGRGIGRKLLKGVLDYFEGEKFYLETQNPNMIKLATELGFRRSAGSETNEVAAIANWKQFRAAPWAYSWGIVESMLKSKSNQEPRDYAFMVKDQV